MDVYCNAVTQFASRFADYEDLVQAILTEFKAYVAYQDRQIQRRSAPLPFNLVQTKIQLKIRYDKTEA